VNLPRQLSRQRKPFVQGNWPIPLLLAGLWTARYMHGSRFGLYEDDLTHIPSAIQMTWSEIGAFAVDVVSNFRGGGHPFHPVLIYVLAKLGWQLGALQGLYLLGYCLIGLNTVLFFKLVQRLGGTALAGLAGVGYVVYAADTTQAFLTHSFGIQTALAMILVAFHVYLSGGRLVPYALAAAAILTYETTFLVFLAAPLMVSSWDGEWRRSYFRHALVMGTILLADVAVRVAVGEGRVGSLGLGQILTVPVVHMIEGPPVALGTYLYRPIQSLSTLDIEKTIVVALSGTVLVGILTIWRQTPFATVRSQFHPEAPSGTTSAPTKTAWQRLLEWLPEELLPLIKTGAIGLVMLGLAYPLTFTVRAYALTGRDTRVHAAGVMGASLLVGSMMLAAVRLGGPRGKRTVVALALALWSGLMVSYGLDVQRDYVRAWDLQREFWTQLVKLVPDVGDGTIVLVDPTGLQDTKQIGANYWNLPRVLGQLYAFPREWDAIPRVYRMVPGWEDRVVTEDSRLRIDETTTFSPGSTYGVFDPSNAILVVQGPDGLTRLAEISQAGHAAISLMAPRGIGEPSYQPTLLHALLVSSGEGADEVDSAK